MESQDSALTLLEAYEQLVSSRHAERPEMANRYRKACQLFSEFAGVLPLASHVKRADLSRFEAWLLDRGRKPRTAAFYRSLIGQIAKGAVPRMPPSEVLIWLRKVYAPTRDISARSLKSYGCACNQLSQWLGRPATWGDLTEATLERYVDSEDPREHQPASRNRRCRHVETLRSLLYYKTEGKGKPKRESKNPILKLWRAAEAGEQGPPDSLVYLCVQVYFKRHLRIRTDDTRRHYRIALGNFAEFLGHPPTPADLDDDNVAGMMKLILDKKLTIRTANERRARINALWTWLAKRGYINPVRFPTTTKLEEPRPVPVALTREQLATLYETMGKEPGMIGDIPARLWWQSLFQVAWATGERIGALRELKWEHFDLAGGWLNVPHEIRKGRTQGRLYRLTPQAIQLLEQVREPARDLVWPWPCRQEYLWPRLKSIFGKAGLPTVPRKYSFHIFRKSVASHAEAAGGDATALLGHSSRSVTLAYLDPRIAKERSAAEYLFPIE